MWSPTLMLLRWGSVLGTRSGPAAGGHGLSAHALGEVEAAVGAALGELEIMRRETITRIDTRSLGFVPLGILAALLAWALFDKHHEWLSALIYAGFGIAGGAALAYHAPEKAYRDAYKSRIIPQLARRFGDLTYRAAQEPDLAQLARIGLLPRFGKKLVEDEIFGRYRDVPVRIVEANLETGGKHSRVVFNGLVVAMEFPGRFSGTTLVTQEAGGLFGGLADVLRFDDLARVRLEDPRFEDRYQVYSTDQIAARALLTPAVMERVMALEAGHDKEPPRLLVEPNMLWVTLPKGHADNLFEPPNLAEPADGAVGTMLETLSRDIGAVLNFIDAVIALPPRHLAPEPPPRPPDTGA